LSFLEIDIVLKAHSKIADREMDLSYYGAFMAAALSRAKKIPEYKKFAPRKDVKKQQTPDQMKTAAMLIAAAFGGTIQ
jgi:hypothetical protein